MSLKHETVPKKHKYYNKSFPAVRADLQPKLKISNINLTYSYSGLLEPGYKLSGYLSILLG